MTRTYLATAFAAALALAGAAGAAELRVASGAPPTHPASDPMYKSFVDSLAEQNAGVTARAMGLEVADLRGMIPNLQSGLIDVGNVLTTYFPADFPQNNLLTDLATLGKVGQAMTGAVTEYTFTCPECLAEFDKLGTVYLGSSSTSSFWLHTNKPVASLADLKGLRVRAGGAPFIRWAESMGMLPQNISFNEEFEALNTGLLDATIAPPVNLGASRLFEVVKNTIMVPIGSTHSASFTMKKETWQGLSDTERQAVIKAALIGLARFCPGMDAAGVAALETAKGAGIAVIEPPADLAAANTAYETAAMDAVAEIGRQNGIADAAERVARFNDLVKKWQGLVEGLGDDPQEMADLMEKEIFSKVDLASLGQ